LHKQWCIADKFNVLRSAAQSQQDYVFREITNIYAPLAERLGLRGLALQFRDEVFRHAKKADFEKTENDIKRVLGVDRNHALAHMEKKKKSVEEKLKEKNIRAQVNVRVKGAYSTFEKIVSRDDIKSVDDVYDLLGIEIVFSNEADMWSGSDLPESYGKVIQSMRETKRYEEDRITVLHNTVKDEQGRYYEFQLMTDDSHQKLQYGPRAHWLYKLERETGQQFDADFVVRTDDFFKDFESVKNSLEIGRAHV